MPHEGVLSGPDEDLRVPRESLGKYILDCLRSRGPDEVIAVNPITDEKLTVGSFLRETIKTSKALKRLNLEKGDVVAIVCENTLRYCIPVVAALNIGVVVNPINPLYTEGELRHCLQISKPRLVLCSSATLEKVKNVQNEFNVEMVVTMGKGDLNGPEIPNLHALAELEDGDLHVDDFDVAVTGAFVLLSSGTTGLPKGVLLTHLNFRVAFHYLRDPRYAGISFGDITVHSLPFFHIFGLLLFLTGVSAGMKLIFLDKFKPDVYLQAIQDHQVNKLYIVPPILLLLTKSPLAKNYDFSSVKDILVGGAPVAKELQQYALETMKGTTVRQMYGMTELCGAVIFQKLSKNTTGSVGVLIPSLQAKVVEVDRDKALGPGQTGELCFKGDMVMKEYLGNAHETRHCMDGDGFLHSGDLGYYDENGQFYIVDRVKELIKYKGFQVAPAELEALLLTHPGVKDCGVIGIPDERAGQVPLAYIASRDANITQQEVLDYVAERISVQKRLYGGVIFVNEIPKNASGKILRRKLVEDFLNRKPYGC